MGSSIAFRLPLRLPVALTSWLASGMEEWPGVGRGHSLILKRPSRSINCASAI